MKKILILALILIAVSAYSKIGTPCASDDKCIQEWEFCGEKKKCVHKKFFPLFLMEYIGSFLCMICLVYSNSGGLGGGGMLIPVAMDFYKFDAKNAIALSNSTIFMSAFVRFICNLFKKHPFKKYGVIIDFDYAIIMMPTVIVGTAIGVFVYVILPSIIIIACLTAGLLWLCYVCAKNGYRNYKKENASKI